MVDAGVVLGGLGLGTAIASLLYAHGQVRAARSQAEAAAGASRLQLTTQTIDRHRELRRDRFTNPKTLAATLGASPAVAKLIEDVGGVDVFLVYRDYVDNFQENFFLRREGIFPDDHWRLWQSAHMAGPAGIPEFVKVFRFCQDHDILDPDFVTFFEPILRGEEAKDPARRKPRG